MAFYSLVTRRDNRVSDKLWTLTNVGCNTNGAQLVKRVARPKRFWKLIANFLQLHIRKVSVFVNSDSKAEMYVLQSKATRVSCS